MIRCTNLAHPHPKPADLPMDKRDSDAAFGGSIPEVYDACMVPLIFEPYATDLAHRLAEKRPRRVLEIAAGTGVVTRSIVAMLPSDVEIVATDLSQSMLDRAARIGTDRPIEWRQADAMKLPFQDAIFDAVVCQFGVMFFPDHAAAYAEARRVLVPGGTFLFNAWDRIEENAFADSVTSSLATLFPEDPPRFLARVPHGYHDREVIASDLLRGGFAKVPVIETLALRSRADTPRLPALAYCHGSPLRNEIETHGGDALANATRTCADDIVARFGSGAVDGKIQAHVVTIEA
jgi:SAM-dependent methyltransferase